MGLSLVTVFTLLLITASLPNSQAAAESAAAVFESSVRYGWTAVKYVGAFVGNACESSVYYGCPAVKYVGAAAGDALESSVYYGTATRDIGLGIYNSVKDVYKNSYSFGSSAASNVDAAIREGSKRYLQDEKARSDLASLVESTVFTIMQELAKGVPGGVPAYNIISKTFHGGGDKKSQDSEDQSEVTKLISDVAKTIGLYAIEKGAQNVPGGVSAYKLISQYLQPLRENEDRRRELKELNARINKLEKEGCSCKKPNDETEKLNQD